jgi:hypothetical protein
MANSAHCCCAGHQGLTLIGSTFLPPKLICRQKSSWLATCTAEHTEAVENYHKELPLVPKLHLQRLQDRSYSVFALPVEASLLGAEGILQAQPD